MHTETRHSVSGGFQRKSSVPLCVLRGEKLRRRGFFRRSFYRRQRRLTNRLPSGRSTTENTEYTEGLSGGDFQPPPRRRRETSAVKKADCAGTGLPTGIERQRTLSAQRLARRRSVMRFVDLVRFGAVFRIGPMATRGTSCRSAVPSRGRVRWRGRGRRSPKTGATPDDTGFT